MGLELVYNPNLDAVCVKATGTLDYEVGKELVEKILKVALKHRCRRVFCDYSEMKLTASSFDIYDNPDHFEQWGVPHDFCVVVVYAERENEYKMWENVARTKGYSAWAFQDKEQAIEWLTKNTSC